MFELRRSVTASARACLTWGLLVFSPLGVFTGSLGSKGRENGPLVPGTPTGRPPGLASAREAKRRNRIAPFESRSSCRFQAASTGQAADTSTGPFEPSRVGFDLHIDTSW